MRLAWVTRQAIKPSVEDLKRIFDVANSEAGSAAYKMWREATGLESLLSQLADAQPDWIPTTGGSNNKPFEDAVAKLVRIVGIFTVVQALERPLGPDETREAVISRTKTAIDKKGLDKGGLLRAMLG